MQHDDKPGTGGKIDLILYRLETIERQTLNLVQQDVYQVQRTATVARISELEDSRTKDRDERHKIWLAVAVALVAPLFSRAGDILGLFTTTAR